MKFSPAAFNFQRVSAIRERRYNYLGNLGAIHFDYNSSGNSFSISPIRFTGGARDRSVPFVVPQLFSPIDRMKAFKTASETDETDLDRDFAQGSTNVSSHVQGIQRIRFEGLVSPPQIPMHDDAPPSRDPQRRGLK